MLLMMEGAVMLLATLCAVYYHFTLGEQDWAPLGLGTIVTLSVGTFMYRFFHTENRSERVFSRGDSFVVVALTWVIFSAFGMLPFVLYPAADIGVVDAYFETMSGFTTFGASMFLHPEVLPHGLLLWRALTQAMGGLGIIVITMALIPAGEMKNTNIFVAEASVVSMDRLRPKIGATARRLLAVYLLFIVACFALYWAGPMGVFDALCHALATVSTGGFSNYGAGIGHFQSAYVEWVTIVFMLLSSINYATYYYFSARNFRMVARNEELQTFLYMYIGMVAVFCLMFTFGINGVDVQGAEVGGQPVRTAFFHVASMMSTCSHTGQFSNYVAWGTSFWMLTVVMKLIGGCTYSTSGGLKVARILLFVRSVVNEFIQHLHPRAVLGVRINGHVLSDGIVRRATNFLFIHLFLVLVGVFLLLLMDIGLQDSIDLIVSSLSNVGPNLDYRALPLAAKLLVCFYMVAGRLEIFTFLFLFLPRAWKN